MAAEVHDVAEDDVAPTRQDLPFSNPHEPFTSAVEEHVGYPCGIWQD